MKLYGLLESMYIQSIFPLDQIHIPHKDLFNKLAREEQSNVLSVGIQLHALEKVLKIPPVEFHGQEIFFELYEYFNNLGRKVHFLEEKEYFEGMAEVIRKAKEINGKSRNNGNNKEELRLENYKLKIEFEYRQAIGINEVLLRNIAKHKPDSVFVGDGHASWFYLHRQEIKDKYGVEITEYWKDVVEKEPTYDDLMLAAGACDKNLSMESILSNEFDVITKKVEPDEKVELELQTLLAQRSYDAVNKGRVTDGNPHFIGTWDLSLEPRGLFEIFVDKAERRNGNLFISGTIEDCLGSATIHGDLSDDFIKFTKVYYNHMGGSENPISYEAAKSNGEFSGTYGGNDIDPFLQKKFKMKQLREVA